MGEKITFQKLEGGQFVPADDPDSAAGRLSANSHSLLYRVTDWVIVDNVAGYDHSREREKFTFYKDEEAETRLRCILSDDRRILHSIREEGMECIGTTMSLDIVPIENVEIEGAIRHWPANPDSEFKTSRQDQLIATLGIPRIRFDWIIDRLRNQSAVLNVSISMPLYKTAIASSFDEPWMIQDFYFPYEAITPIFAYEIYAVDGPGYGKLIDKEEESDSEESLPENLEEDDSGPETIRSKGLLDQNAINDHLKVIKIALIVLVIVQLISLSF